MQHFEAGRFDVIDDFSHELPIRLIKKIPVTTYHADHRIDGFGPGARIKNTVELRLSNFHEHA